MPRLPRKLLILYSNQLLREVGASLIDVFGTIFLYQIFSESLWQVAVVMGLSYVVYMLLSPPVARLLGRYSRASLMILGTLAMIGSLVPFVFFADQPLLLAIIFIPLSGLFRSLFWMPYHITLSQSLHKGETGQELAALRIASSIVLGLLPIAAGVIISRLSFGTLFGVSIAIFVLSLVPLFFLGRHDRDHFDFTDRQTWRELFRRANRRLLIAHAAGGANQMGRSIFWPVFLFVVLPEQYQAIGLISGGAILLVLLVRLTTGRLLDKSRHRHKILTISSRLQSLAWIGRMLPITPIQVFITDSFFKLTDSMNQLGYDKYFYDHASANHSRADEYIVIRNLALNIGRIAMLVIGVITVELFGLRAVFIPLALAVILMNRIVKERKIKKGKA